MDQVGLFAHAEHQHLAAEELALAHAQGESPRHHHACETEPEGQHHDTAPDIVDRREVLQRHQGQAAGEEGHQRADDVAAPTVAAVGGVQAHRGHRQHEHTGEHQATQRHAAAEGLVDQVEVAEEADQDGRLEGQEQGDEFGGGEEKNPAASGMEGVRDGAHVNSCKCIGGLPEPSGAVESPPLLAACPSWGPESSFWDHEGV